jgi:hypothetical protein
VLMHPPEGSDWKKAEEILSLVDPAKDAVSGAWKLESGRLQSPPSGPALLELPWIPGPDYDLGLSFVASQGAGELAVSLPSASGPLLWLGRVPSGGDEQRAEFRVRGNRVEVTLRGTNFERRETYVGSPASDAKWVFRNPRAVGLGASGGGVEFRRAEILGQGARSRS